MLDDQTPLPESGWECVHVEDYGDGSERCEMCDCERVRYVHVMEHNELPLTKMMGCVCAEKYGGDPALPKLREKNLRNRATRRRKWLTRRWRVSHKGNDYLKTGEQVVGIYRSGPIWLLAQLAGI